MGRDSQPGGVLLPRLDDVFEGKEQRNARAAREDGANQVLQEGAVHRLRQGRKGQAGISDSRPLGALELGALASALAHVRNLIKCIKHRAQQPLRLSEHALRVVR